MVAAFLIAALNGHGEHRQEKSQWHKPLFVLTHECGALSSPRPTIVAVLPFFSSFSICQEEAVELTTVSFSPPKYT